MFMWNKIIWISKLPTKPICTIVYLTIILSAPFNHDDSRISYLEYRKSSIIIHNFGLSNYKIFFFCLQFQDSLHLTDKINACQGHGQTQNKNPYIWDWSVVFGSTLSLVDSDIWLVDYQMYLDGWTKKCKTTN